MTPHDRNRLTSLLRAQVADIAADLRAQMLGGGPEGPAVRARAERLYRDEAVGEAYEVWTDLLSRRAAVLWVLKSVYVRVLEDKGLLSPGRLLDAEAQQLFEQLAPSLGETAFLRWIYHDLASSRGGLPELFAPQPAEVAWPSNALSRALIAFWRHRDADTGAAWGFADERFEGELMGDLYQELDPVVKDRFALCQTPDFVRAFMLDRTLTPAIETFGAAHVRLLDPACGSGHFLIDALKRLVAAARLAAPEGAPGPQVRDALARVVGIDLNDYACGLARARLVMTAAELAGVRTLAEAAAFRPQVYWADGLEQVERTPPRAEVQFDLFAPAAVERPQAVLSRTDGRHALAKVLKAGFQVVVANPPYITEKDEARKTYHREKLGKSQRYVSAYRQYSLGSPFTERCFQLATPAGKGRGAQGGEQAGPRDQAGYVGIITSNNFMKREFGRPLIEEVLAGLDLSLVVDTSQAYIPHHGTPTVMLFGRHRPPSTPTVRAVMGKRGESGVPADPAQGQVWSSVVAGWNAVGFENEYVSVAEMTRDVLAVHPWSLGGGGAADLRSFLEDTCQLRLGGLVESIGFGAISGADDVFVQLPSVLERQGVVHSLPLGTGDIVRDWSCAFSENIVWPYGVEAQPLSEAEVADVLAYFRPHRTILKDRKVFSRPIEERGLSWWSVREVYPNRFRTPLSIAFAFVATHNHFVLDRGGKVFNRSAPIIKLPPEATEDEHLALLGLLNSSTACFWMKQVFHCKGSQGVNEGIRGAQWEQFIEFDATKARLFPIVSNAAQALPYAMAIDALATMRREASVARVLASAESMESSARLRRSLDERQQSDLQSLLQMVGLQEELDWLCYRAYGLDPSSDVVPAESVVPISPNALPWCLELAQTDTEHRAAMAAGEAPHEQPTGWFRRHGWTPLDVVPPSLPADVRARIAARRERTANTPALALIETANFKRRWYRPDYAAEEQAALKLWFAERAEAEARTRSRPFALSHLVAALQDDPQVLAVGEVLTGRADFSLATVLAEVLQAESVPNHPLHRYKPSGLVKRAVWERTWHDQRREDAGEHVQPEVPPSYGSVDFLKAEYWRLRGKLDVPQERFIAFAEVPGAQGTDTLYGWAGWTPRERLKALMSIDEDLEDAGMTLVQRAGVLDSAWRLLPDVAREDATAAANLKAELQYLLGADGPSPELLAQWQAQAAPTPPTRGRKATPKAAKVPKSKAKPTPDDPEDEA